MNLPTLDEFLADKSFIRSTHVNVPGIQSLYVRKGPRYVRVNGEMKRYPWALTIANIMVSNREEDLGKGVFTQLIARIRHNYPDLPIFMENVLNPRLRTKLLSLGFKRDESSDDLSACYIME